MNDCPICGCELNIDNYYDSDINMTVESIDICKNGCYVDEFMYGSTRITIFGKEFFGKDKENIKKEIEYWKENDKYLIKIMTQNR